MNLVPPSPHHSRCGPGDLIALVRVWKWEDQVRDRLGDVVHGHGLSVAYQPIFRLQGSAPVVGGYEAYARFPGAPRVPTRLWFRVAAEEGVGIDLEVNAVLTALRSAAIPRHQFLAVNSSLAALRDVLDILAGRPTSHVVEIPHVSIHRPHFADQVAAAQEVGIKVAIDDVPLADLHRLEEDLGRIAPDMVKVDLLGGLVDEPMARFNLAAGVAWCDADGIELVAERVERRRDVEILAELGVPWAQGYALSRPEAAAPSPMDVSSVD